MPNVAIVPKVNVAIDNLRLVGFVLSMSLTFRSWFDAFFSWFGLASCSKYRIGARQEMCHSVVPLAQQGGSEFNHKPKSLFRQAIQSKLGLFQRVVDSQFRI
jgi:hypothetical protein